MHPKRKPHIPIPLKSVSGRIGETRQEAAQLLLLEDKSPKILDPHNPYLPSPFLTEQTITNYTFNPNYPPYPNNPTPQYAYTTPEDIKNILRTRNNQTAPGNDIITYKFLKITNILHPTLISDLANACLHFQIFPQTFKEAKVSVILKPNKDPTYTNAYLPISLLKVLGKKLERVICNYINHKMNQPLTTQPLPSPLPSLSNLYAIPPTNTTPTIRPTLSPHQYGFCKSMTAEAAITSHHTPKNIKTYPTI